MRELRDKVAVVTGAASGIGRAMATRFAHEGMRVVLADVELAALDEAVSEIKAAGFNAIGVATDVADLAAVEALAARALDAFGAVHIVCNNAGVEPRGFMAALHDPPPMWEESLDEWHWVLGVNLWGVVHGIRVFAPILIAQNEPGHIVNTASVAGFVSRPGGGAYGASKHAVVRITEGLYFQLARLSSAVNVSLLAPGAVTTRIASAYRNQPAAIAAVDGEPNADDLARLDRLLESHDGRDPADVADLVVQAIHAEQFYVFTDDKAQANIRARMERILARQNPHERR